MLQSAGRMLGMAILLAASAASADGTLAWTFTAKQTDWGQPCGITLIQEDDALLLDVYAPDSRIVARNLAVACDKVSAVRITYRAEEFAGQTDGELYYATDKFPDLTDARRFSIGTLIADGKVHELLINTTAWRGKGTIKVLRLDLVNQAPGLIHLMKIELVEK